MFSRRLSSAVVVLLVVLVTVALVVSAVPGFAASRSALPQHARLLAAAPADGSTVASAEEVVLTFSEDVEPEFLQVVVEGPGGAEADGDPRVDGRTVTQPLVRDLPAGEHEVTYRVVSVDGHPVSGTVRFTTTAAPATTAPSSPTATSAAPTQAPTDSPTASAPDVTAAGSVVPGWALGLLAAVAVLAVGLTLLARARRTPEDASGGSGRTDFTTRQDG